MLPDTRYARSGDLRIAYQVVGDGPIDLVFVPGFVSNLDLAWDDPVFAGFIDRLAGFSRLIRFDKRGTGLSDRMGDLPSLEVRMDDVRAVMDAAGSERAALFGISEGGAMAMVFAATYPERTRALVLFGAYAHYATWVVPPDRLDGVLARLDALWGTGEMVDGFAPSRAADPQFKAWWARWERLGASPSAAVHLTRMNSEIDVRPIVPSIRVPTLILHRVGDTRVSVEAGRYLARHIPAATYVELPGEDHLLWCGNADRVADEIEEFLTGSRPEVEPDRVLATVMFTDIVDSTTRAASLGDQAWSALLERHDALVRRELARFRGREVKTTGDGFLATFDGPARGVRCGEAIVEAVGTLGLDVRVGLHTGEIEIRPGDDIGGIAVHIASRVMALAGPGEVVVTGTVRDLVAGSSLAFVERGRHPLKGLIEEVRLFASRARTGAR
ncbi:MAG TPA: adenylate/guanylate cyclase domain-containing protein [Beijerinckiaceae bacterium]|nr:adenylate/guanylate cyclase domain-containing protein [Beijerinckiaceae bacterium]